MRVTTFFSAADVDPAEVVGSTAIVIDVIRATSSIVEALAAGARAVYPTHSTEDAIRLANSLGRDQALLCGERKGLRIDGFDLGNSPYEFTPERVADASLVMSTTNGTRAFVAAEDADRVLAASLLNLGAVAASVDRDDRICFVCAGKEDRFSLDDALCAGLILEAVLDRREAGNLELDDASRAILAIARTHEADAEVLRSTAAGQALVDVGLEADLERCAEVDRHDLVPEMRDRAIRVPGNQ